MTLFARFYKTTPPETVENALSIQHFHAWLSVSPPVYPQTQTWSFAFFLIRWRRVVDVAKRMCPMSKCRTSLSLPNKESECVRYSNGCPALTCSSLLPHLIFHCTRPLQYIQRPAIWWVYISVVTWVGSFFIPPHFTTRTRRAQWSLSESVPTHLAPLLPP